MGKIIRDECMIDEAIKIVFNSVWEIIIIDINASEMIAIMNSFVDVNILANRINGITFCHLIKTKLLFQSSHLAIITIHLWKGKIPIFIATDTNISISIHSNNSNIEVVGFCHNLINKTPIDENDWKIKRINRFSFFSGVNQYKKDIELISIIIHSTTHLLHLKNKIGGMANK